MGGTGSGSWYRWDSKDTTESQHKIDIRWMRKQGYLRLGMAGALSWSRRREQTGWISFRVEQGQVVLNYRQRPNGSEWENVEQIVKFDRTPCNYGGYRMWFLCPHCWRRVAVLYWVRKYFLCRHCHDLTYTTQQESGPDRLRRKARKIRAKLGAEVDNLTIPILFKPKNMHQKTFDRLRKEADDASLRSLLLMGQRIGLSY